MQRISQLTAIPIAMALGLWAFTAIGQEKVHKVGYIADLSGPMQDNYSPIYEAFDYYVKELNARGGIDGIPVRLFIRDDQLDATRAASVALELIASEGVGSLWGMSQSRTHLAVYQTAQRNRVPAVAMFSGIKEILPPKPLPFAYSAGHVFEVAGEVSGKLAAQLVKGTGKGDLQQHRIARRRRGMSIHGRRCPSGRIADRHSPVSADRDRIRRHRPANGRHAAQRSWWRTPAPARTSD